MVHIQALKVLHHLVWNDPARKSKILLKIKISGKTGSLGMSNNGSPRSQKNHRNK